MRMRDLDEAAPRQIIAAQLQASTNNGQPAACVCVGEEIETFDENTLRYIYPQLHAYRFYRFRHHLHHKSQIAKIQTKHLLAHFQA